MRSHQGRPFHGFSSAWTSSGHSDACPYCSATCLMVPLPNRLSNTSFVCYWVFWVFNASLPTCVGPQ